MNKKLLDEYLQKMKSIADQKYHDEEVDHGNADDLLCELLKKLGYGKIIDEYNKIEKWYA